MTETPEEAPDEAHVDTRADLLPEEQRVGSDDPHEQAREILEESVERTEHPEETRRESSQTPDQPA
jgi:hypothetical protein